MLAVGLVLILLGWSRPLPDGWIPWRAQVLTFVGVLGIPILGGVIAARLPRNPYGWLWLGMGGAVSLLFFAQVYATYAIAAVPGALPFSRTMGTVVAGWGWTVWLVLTPFVFLLFPAGRMPSPRWRPLAWVILLAGTVGIVAGPFVPGRSGFAPIVSPLGIQGVAGQIALVLSYGTVVLILATVPLAALSLVFRFRRSSGAERQQIKWFAYAAVVFVLEYLTQFFYEPPGSWDALVEILPLVGLYSAIGVAILRHRLYDIDLIINRTLVYAVLTASLVCVYLTSVVSIQYAFRTLAGGESQLAVVASTLAIAALFNPLRRGVQGVVDRRFYRAKYDAAKSLEEFSRRLRDETDLDALRAGSVAVVRETVAPEHVSLWLRADTGGRGAGR
jgi:hypothetical protein